MEKRDYPLLNEQVYWDVLPNGLQIAVIPRQGFSKKVAYLAVDYGSIHREFTVDGKKVTAPMGVAHYLEHKLFDLPGRDVSAEFAAMGAMSNAFTSFDMTAYYFSCTEHFADCLGLLLEFVTTPYFTDESVQKEQGIIGQEIEMDKDAPESAIFENLMKTMYRAHPVRESVLGTVESIAQITPQVLYDCHRAFYRPDNMLLCVMADLEPAQVRQIALEMTAHMPCPRVEAVQQWQEPELPACQTVTGTMEVAMPMFQIGFRCEPLGMGEPAIYQEIVGDLAAEALFGESSALYLRLYEEGWIDSSFGGGFETIRGMAMVTVSGDSDVPEQVRDAISKQAEQLVAHGIPETDFLRMKRSAMGRRIRGLDSFDSTCFRVCAYHFSGFDYFRFPAVYQAVQAQDVCRFLQKTLTKQNCCMSVIYPKEDKVC